MFKSTKKTALGHPNQQIKKYNYLIISDLYKNRDHNCRSQEKAEAARKEAEERARAEAEKAKNQAKERTNQEAKKLKEKFKIP
jgi:hypothetical protein